MSDTQLNSPPTHQERQIANEGFQKLIAAIDEIGHPENTPEISILETGEPIQIPLKVLKMLAEILRNYRDGNAVSIVPVGTAFTTQKAAEFLNCSRPHVTKLIDQGKLKAEMVGRHRRVQFEDLIKFKKNMIKERKEALIELMRDSEELGLYETD
ncbi:MAG: helix-turn-helix domain-containing protein [Imperialibacter sp.]|uniref:helix-turn-helix domain-containing protein n=1 Tax=Imperialibacter sp. TaxID=2038411 RepID=UPI003A88D570